MKALGIILLILVVVGGGYFLWNRQIPAPIQNPTVPLNQPKPMKVTSSAFLQGTPIPSKYTCDGQNINPPLEISDVPSEAKSLALIMHDPDAPVAGGFTHWVMYNIPPSTKSIAENSVPTGGTIQGLNGANKAAYAGPCPPSGVHHYYFRVYALDTILDFNGPANKSQLEKAMLEHRIIQGELMGTYTRGK